MRKLLSVSIAVTGFTVIFGINAFAYIDPSVTTYAIQAITAIVIAAGAFITIFWRRAKKKVSKRLGIDENKNKEVEEEVMEFKEDEINK